MTCREVVEFLAEYLSAELPLDQRRAFDEHLKACPECRAYLQSYAAAVKLGKAASGQPEPVPEELVRAVLAARRKGS